MAPTHITRSTPKRSAIAPATGWPSPHNRFWTASARPKTSRPHENSWPIGCTKKPRLDRGPKLSNAITQPQTMITSGVRQLLVSPAAGLELSAVTAMAFPRWLVTGLRKGPARYRQLMHSHGNPNRHLGETGRRNAALQIRASRFDDLAVQPPSEATGGVLYVICSL